MQCPEGMTSQDRARIAALCNPRLRQYLYRYRDWRSNPAVLAEIIAGLREVADRYSEYVVALRTRNGMDTSPGWFDRYIDWSFPGRTPTGSTREL